MGNFVYNNRSYDTLDEMTLAMNLNELYRLRDDLSDKLFDCFEKTRKSRAHKVLNSVANLVTFSGGLVAAISAIWGGELKSTFIGLGLGIAAGGLIGGALTAIKANENKDDEIVFSRLADLLFSVNNAIEQKEYAREIFPELAEEESEKNFSVLVK